MTRKLIFLSLVALVAAVALAPSSASAATVQFSNSAEIVIPQQGAAATYPSTVSVNNLRGPVTDVQVTLRGVSHTRPRDLDVILVAPDGSRVILMSDVCGDGDVLNRTWTFHSNGGLPDMGNAECPNLNYADSNWESPDNWPGIGLLGGSGELSGWHEKVKPGAWKLYVVDDEAGDSGTIAGGWTLTLTTGPVDVMIPAEGASGPAAPYPATMQFAGKPGEIVSDVDVDLGQGTHDRPQDLDLLLVGPQGQETLLMSDACGKEPFPLPFAFDDESEYSLPLEAGLECIVNARPTDFEPGDAFPAPAPVGPYGASLSVFDHTDPSGEWKLYAVDDDASAGDGYLLKRFKLSIATRPRASIAFAEQAAAVTEGTKRALTITRSAISALGPASVTVTTTPGTAGAGTDYTAITRTVQFAAGQTTQTVEVDAARDSLAEPTETFAVELGNPTGDAAIGTPARADVTIVDGSVKQAAAKCATRAATIVGTARRDVLRGTRRADVIAALAGNDRVEGLRGNDLICGGAGRDRLIGGRGRDRLVGGAGRDICLGGPGRDRVRCP